MNNATKTTTTYQEARTYLATLEARERERTGIRTLRVGWNESHGYYIEITLAATSRRFSENAAWDIPPDYEVISSPMNVHRFVTADLIRHESIVMTGQNDE